MAVCIPKRKPTRKKHEKFGWISDLNDFFYIDEDTYEKSKCIVKFMANDEDDSNMMSRVYRQSCKIFGHEQQDGSIKVYNYHVEEFETLTNKEEFNNKYFMEAI